MHYQRIAHAHAHARDCTSVNAHCAHQHCTCKQIACARGFARALHSTTAIKIEELAQARSALQQISLLLAAKSCRRDCFRKNSRRNGPISYALVSELAREGSPARERRPRWRAANLVTGLNGKPPSPRKQGRRP
eukprot:6213620-Pleurochrysis_carterae.AAC.1